MYNLHQLSEYTYPSNQDKGLIQLICSSMSFVHPSHPLPPSAKHKETLHKSSLPHFVSWFLGNTALCFAALPTNRCDYNLTPPMGAGSFYFTVPHQTPPTTTVHCGTSSMKSSLLVQYVRECSGLLFSAFLLALLTSSNSVPPPFRLVSDLCSLRPLPHSCGTVQKMSKSLSQAFSTSSLQQ